MTGSTLTLAPKPHKGLGAGANTEPSRVIDLEARASALNRGARPDYPAWLRHVAPAAGCAHPVRLAGTVTVADTRHRRGRLVEVDGSRCPTG